MTTIIDRAAEVIYRTLSCKYGDFCYHEDTAQALAAEGLLMPDLPKPDREGYWWPKAVTLGTVSKTPRGEIRIQSGNFQNFQMYLTTEKALDLAAILTAAAMEEA